MNKKYVSSLKRVTFLVDDAMMEKINVLKKHNTHLSITEVIRASLNAYYKDSFKYGANPLMDDLSSGTSEEKIIKKAEQKAIIKKAEKEANENLLFKPQIDICLNTLGGEIEIDELGFKYCRFTSYGRDASGDATQKVPLKLVDPIYEQTMLFSPSKKAVLAKRPELADKFK